MSFRSFGDVDVEKLAHLAVGPSLDGTIAGVQAQALSAAREYLAPRGSGRC